MTLNEWANAALAHQFGNYIDVDGYYQGQCWDLAAHYAINVVGCPSLPTVTGGAEGVYNRFAPPIPDYFTRVKNNSADPNQLPPAGALIVYGPTSGNPYGHIEVVMGSNAQGVDVIYQDGFNQTQGPIRKFRKWGALPTLGWLVPKKNVQQTDLQPFQRIVGDAGVYRRKTATTNESSIELFKGGEVLDFGGWLYGQPVDNNNVWFKGRYSDTYFWSGAFTDAGTHDLADLNPVAPPPVTNPAQRTVVDGGLNVRSEASTLAQIIKVLPQGTQVVVTGYTTKGANVDGNTLWFRTQDGYVWSGGLDNQSTDNVENVTPADTHLPTDNPPEVPAAPQYPAETTDPLVTAVFNKKHPIGKDYAPTDLVTIAGQKLRKEAAAAISLMGTRALAEGVTLTPGSGYRSYATQVTVYNNYVAQDGQAKADTYSARPGYSEHQTGLTMDFAPIDDSFANTPSDIWLRANAHKYGFIMRYPADKVAITGYQYEPWHYRYVGVKVAADVKAQGKTLEEYFGITGGLYPEQEPTTPTEPAEPTIPTDPGTNPTPDPETPTQPPAPADEAAKSATAFVARIASQLVAAGIIANGLATLLTTYASITVSAQNIGLATFGIALALVAYAQ
jgi:D-alanyl-D-alanine carboxypeptidase